MRGRLANLVNWAILIAAIIGIIYPAFFDPHLSLTQILISLADFNQITLSFLMRWLSVLVFLFAVYIMITNWAYRNLPISVIWTRLDVHFESPDGSKVRIDREQALRANQTGVTAYYVNCKPTAEKGRVPEDGISCSVYCGDQEFKSDIDLHGSEARGFEIMHLFGNQLPYAWYMPLIPRWLLNREPERLFRWVRTKVAIRRMSIKYLDEFNVAKPSVSFIAAIYPHYNVAVSLHFPPNTSTRNLRARRIKTNGVVEMPWRNQGNVFSIFIDRLENETLRITWT
jgi:hypothetical protein